MGLIFVKFSMLITTLHLDYKRLHTLGTSSLYKWKQILKIKQQKPSVSLDNREGGGASLSPVQLHAPQGCGETEKGNRGEEGKTKRLFSGITSKSGSLGLVEVGLSGRAFPNVWV